MQTQQKTIMVVDDDEDQVTLIATVLRRNGYRVLTATNPLRALQMLESETVALVLTDLMMPHTDGIDLTQRIHAMPLHKDVPVIMLTAYGSGEVHDQSLRKGVAMTLSKPVELLKLLDLVGFAVH